MSNPQNPSLKDRAEYLLNRRFPHARAMLSPPSLSSGRNRNTGPTPEMRERVEAYRAEIAALSPQELVARYNAGKQREYDEAIAKSEREERERFFNQPHATANFAYWSKMAHWTLDEAVALSFGKAPELVHWQAISKYLALSRFAGEYQRRRELAVRAAQWKQLFDPVLPGIFLAWAKGLEIEVPAALVEAVQKRGPIRDWKSFTMNQRRYTQRGKQTGRRWTKRKTERLLQKTELWLLWKIACAIWKGSKPPCRRKSSLAHANARAY
jgi:hypothetical protein